MVIDNLIFVDLSCSSKRQLSLQLPKINYCTLTQVNLTRRKLQSVAKVVDTLVPSLLNSV